MYLKFWAVVIMSLWLFNVFASLHKVEAIGGNTIGGWSQTARMLSGRCRFESVNVGNYVYAIGGQPNIEFNQFATVERSAVLADGSLTPWVLDMALPRERTSFGAVAAVSDGAYVYAIGGWDEEVFDSVLRAAVNADGSLSAWQQMTSLSMPITDLEAVRYGSHIYAIANNQVQRTTILGNGSLSPWTVEEALLNEARTFFAAVVIKNYLYVIAGQDQGVIKSSVERAEINVDGSLGNFEIVNSLGTRRMDLAAVVIDNYVYALGGFSGLGLSSELRTVERALINADGSIGNWQGATQMIDRRRGLEALVVSNHLYALGGTPTLNCLARVEKIEVERDVVPEEPPCSLPNFGDVSGVPLRQTDPRWKDVAYGGTYFTKADGSRVFVPFRIYGDGRDTIGAWGCTLTSATMIVNYFAEQQGNAFRTNPQTLNEWLQNNGGYDSGPKLPNKSNPQYVANAFVNHDKVIEYARNIGTVVATYDGLIKKPTVEPAANFIARTKDVLNSYMCALNPVILGVNGAAHYVDSTALLSDPLETWRIHDPLSIQIGNLNNAYSNQYAQLTKYSTDPLRRSLSIAAHSPVEMIITDPLGRRVGFDQPTGDVISEIPGSSYGMEYLGADDGGGGLIDQLLLDVRGAEVGEYRLRVLGTGDGSYTLEIMAMDEQLNNVKQLIHGEAREGETDTYELNFTQEIDEQMLSVVREIDIDIKPGSADNPVNCSQQNVVIPVAILTTPTFEAMDIDHTTVKFAQAQEFHKHNKTNTPQRHEEDVDNDGDIDLMFHFRLSDTDLTCESNEAILEGKTVDGLKVEGVNSLNIVGN